MDYKDFSASELERLLALLDSFKSVHPDRGVPMGASLEWVRMFAVNGEPDMAMEELAKWLVDVQPAAGEGDRAFIAEMAEAFPAEDAVRLLRDWQVT